MSASVAKGMCHTKAKEDRENTVPGADLGLLQSRERNVIKNINNLKMGKPNNENLSKSITKSIETQNSTITNNTTKHTKKNTQGSGGSVLVKITTTDVIIGYRAENGHNANTGQLQSPRNICASISETIIRTIGGGFITRALGTSVVNLFVINLIILIGSMRKRLLRMNLLGWG